MPLYDNPLDKDDSTAQRAAQEDPWVMYLVVRRERLAPLGAMLAAAAQATVRVVDRYAKDPRHEADFAAWSTRSFRKVCLRANERDFARVGALAVGDGAVAGDAVVRAVAPVLKSARPKLLVHLQAWTDAVDSLPAPEALPSPDAAADAPVMRFLVNAAAGMRAGKMAAQVGHAALLCCAAYADAHGDAFARWAAAGHPCRAFFADESLWEAVKRDEACVRVRDAGLTEVAPGTETVLALPPARTAAWGARFATLRGL